MKQLYVILFTLISFTSSAQELLKDIVTTNASSHPRNMIEANGKMFFVAKGINNNSEVWTTDGTSEGTGVVKNPNLFNGPYISGSNLYSLGNKVLFPAYSYSPQYTGTELWVSDGTSNGTQMLKDIFPGQNSSYPASFYKIGNKMIFMATDEVNGTEPWVTDGTEAGTFMLRDINYGSTGSYFNSTPVLVNNNKLYFTTYTPNEGSELWVTDGTQDGTFMVKDIIPGSGNSSISYMTAVGNKLFFTTNDGINGQELWISNGTEAGTYMIKDIVPGLSSTYFNALFEYNGKLLFVPQDSNYDYELWVSDGTSNGTYLLKNISLNSSSSPQDFIKVGNIVFFTATDGINGRELWKTDGTAAGTLMVKDINLTSVESENYSFSSSSLRKKFVNVNGKLFFLANSGSEGFELWKSDGTAAGTTLVKDFVTGTASASYSNFLPLNSSLFFSATDNSGETNYWNTDGTEPGTKNIIDLDSNVIFRNVYPLTTSSNNQLYFVAYGDDTGYELYKTNGTNVSFLKDIETSNHSSYSNFINKIGINNNVVFAFNDNEHGLELWKTNGLNDTKLLMDFIKYPQGGPNSTDYYSTSSSFNTPFSLNGYSYFIRNNIVWRSDGESVSIWFQSQSTISSMMVSGNKLRWLTRNQIYESNGVTITLIKDLPDWNYSTYSGDVMLDLNGVTYFIYGTNAYGRELWKTDGTAAGTVLLKDIVPGNDNLYMYGNSKQVDNKLFFVAYDGNGYELWVTDGNEWGTYMVKDIYPGNASSYPEYLTNLNDNLLIFIANDGVNGTELWKSDGTSDGTVMVSDIYSGSGSSYPSNSGMKEFAVYNNKLYFGARSNFSDNLYSTDGSSITLIKDGFDAESIIKFDDELFIKASSYNSYLGYELWKSNGTSAGTKLVKDIYSGSNSSYPSNFFAHNNNLYFMADDGIHGNELWIVRPCPDSLNFSSAMSGTSTYQVSKVIVGETANTIASTANITYDAGKYVLLNPGFSTASGAVFSSQIGGCAAVGNITNSVPTQPTKSDAKTQEYLEDLREQPSIEDFIQYGDNKDLKVILAKFEESKLSFIDKQRQLDFDLKNLEKQKTEAQIVNNQQALNNYYTTKAEKERTYEMNSQELSEYNYYIIPVRNEQGEKLGYDLNIYSGGKVYKSSIRY
jgi:ELWxxDGT repeat protein